MQTLQVSLRPRSWVLGALAALVVLAAGPLIGSASASPTPDDLATYEWSGPGGNSQFGNYTLENVGDVNGDGLDDFLVNDRDSSTRSAWVLFGPAPKAAQADLTDLAPSQGYRISSSTATPAPVGDHNGDGISDMVVAASGSIMGNRIVFGIPDPTVLPECNPGVVRTRCLLATFPFDEDGNRVGLRLRQASVAFNGWHRGDFAGTGEQQTVARYAANEQAFVLRGNLDALCPGAVTDPCELQFADLTKDNLVMINGPAGVSFGDSLESPGDINGDGRDDILISSVTDGAAPPTITAVFGKDWDTDAVDTVALGSGDGYRVTSSFAGGITPFSVGDVNGDTVADFVAQYFSVLPAEVKFYVVYGRAGDGVDVDLTSLTPERGYEVRFDESVAVDNRATASALGDLNGDGAGDFIVGNSAASTNATSAGAFSLVFGSRAMRTDPVIVGVDDPSGTSYTVDDDIAAAGLGAFAAPAGDFDDDGLPDFAVARPGMGNGSVLLLAGKSFAPSVLTAAAGPVTDAGATLSGSARLNGRAATTYFEYGTSSDYGEQTATESLDKSNRSLSLEADVTGLTAGTEYHYRAVVVNDLGVKAYGLDRTFTTGAPDRCQVDPTQAGCEGYDHCKSNPTDPVCQKEPQVARLSRLIVGQKTVKVKRGKKGTVKVTVVNTGNDNAAGVKLCASGPKKFVSIPKCKKVGGLAAGKTASATFKVKVKKKARKGKKIALKLKATANGLGAKTAKVNIKVR